MTDLSKGHIKLYIHNDVNLFKDLKESFKNDERVFLIFNFGKEYMNNDVAVPYYIRIKHGHYSGMNTSGDFYIYDTADMIIVDGYDLLKMRNGSLPETLFQM